MENANWINTPGEETQEDDDFVEDTPKVNVTIIDDDSDKDRNAETTKKRKRKSKKQEVNETHIDDESDKEQSAENSKKKKRKSKKPEESKEYADIWKHFTKNWVVEDDDIKRKYGRCKYCSTNLKADPTRNGTSGLRKHFPRCKENPENIEKQNILQFTKQANGESSVGTWKHDEVRIKKALLNLFVVGELPFKFVEHEAFVEYTNALNGRVTLPSRHTISRDVAKYYIDERNKLHAYLSNPNNVIHLTTDTWTSTCQRVNYMVVTAHFVDVGWGMHRRIINFREIDSHKGEDVGLMLLDCIDGWGIKNVMTIAVDNATSNNTAIEFLKSRLPNLYEDGKNLQVRCIAHILNLIVKDGLKEYQYSVDRVTKAVRYIRHSTQRINRFKKCMKTCKLETKKFLCGDCPTRWNSTYEMLKIAVELKEAFLKYEVIDKEYRRELDRVPEKEDFKICSAVVGFLEKFKQKTKNVSSSSEPLAHIFFPEILDVDQHLREWEVTPEFCLKGKDMREKFNKYWGSFDKLNDYMYFAVLLDPQMKSQFILHAFKIMVSYTVTEKNRMTDSDIEQKATSMLREIETKFEKFFMRYKDLYGTESSQKQEVGHEVPRVEKKNGFLGGFLNLGGNSGSTETELKRYLREGNVTYSSGFDILDWWKHNTARFPIVSRMARDILGIQISTVASESAFSMSGRILDDYRTNLSTTIVEALVCTKDWVRKASNPIIDNIDDILKDDDIALAIEEAIRADGGKGKAKMSDGC